MEIFFSYFFTTLQFCFMVQAQIPKLPLVGLKVAEDHYQNPQCVGNISNQLYFYSPGEKSKAIYFCPRFLSDYLLYPTKKNICEIEPTPVLRRVTDEESLTTDCPYTEDSHSLYTYGYQMAYSENFEEEEDPLFAWIDLYTFCFDHFLKRILYFSYRIYSPTLLTSELMEPQSRYLSDTYELNHFGDPVIKKYIRLIRRRYGEYDKYLSNSVRQQAMIATPYDMAFANWKKPFTHIINYAIFRHPLTAIQWSKISLFIRKLAMEGWGELHIKVGMKRHTVGNLHKIWWKLVITPNESHAIAIVMHDIALSEEPAPEDGFKCENRCGLFGFEEMIEPITASLVYCCHPDAITSVMALKSYKLFDLKNKEISKPPPVKCDTNS